MFKLEEVDRKARAGILETAHGTVKTPAIMPVATKATPKNLTTAELKETGAEAIIANAFILSLRPGVEVIEQAGGIHKFMNFDKTIFTDCGGFQILREGFGTKSLKQGILFKDPFEGRKVMITPESIMNIQETIGSDVAMALDDVPFFGVTADEAKAAMKNTHNWADRCIKAHKKKEQLLFGIAHGAFYKELRIESMKETAKKDFNGIALGGLCIGEPKELMHEMINCSIEFAAEEKPRYLMGVGSPVELLETIQQGIDIFDSAFPTQNARHGTLFTSKGMLKIENSKFRNDFSNIDENCSCKTCRHTKAYLHHLFRMHEPTALMLASYHNIYYLQNLMRQARKEIKNNNFNDFLKEIKKWYG